MGIATPFEPDSKGSLAIKVVPGTPNKLVLFLANSFANNNIYTMTFDQAGRSGVADWNLFN